MKPTREMMRQAEQLAKVRSYIDPNRTYRMTGPDGSLMYEWSGEELIRTAEAMAELMEASNAGDEARTLRALLAVEEAAEKT